MLDCMEILAIAAKREIRVYAIKGNWHLDETIQSKIMAIVFSMAAEIERGLISARTKEALHARRASGLPVGRPKGPGKSKLDKHRPEIDVNRHSTVTHYQRPTVTQLQEGGTGGEVSEILFFSAKSKRRPSLIYSMQIIPVCLSIVARRKGVSATRRGGLNWTPISLLVGHPCKLFHRNRGAARQRGHPEVHREALQFFACQPRKLAEEARNQETEAVKSYGRFGTFA